VAEFGVLASEGRREGGEELPRKEEHPQQHGNSEDATVGHRNPGAEPEAEGWTAGDESEDQKDKNVGAEFHRAAAGSK
jgi:hypothetical protein